MKIVGISMFVLLMGVFPVLGAPVVLTGLSYGPGTVYAEEDWKAEFDEICSKTQDAMAFSVEELKVLVERCDKLKPRIEQLEGTQRKVCLKRLQMCRDLFSFTLESKEKK